MPYPPDLPWMIEWRMHLERQKPRVLTSLPRRDVRGVGSNGATDVMIVRPRIPAGALAWRLPGEQTWRSLRELPAAWMPFLNRAEWA
jgi:hypothetical protein